MSSAAKFIGCVVLSPTAIGKALEKLAVVAPPGVVLNCTDI